MAKSSLGKIVSRVGASGGGKTYAKARPSNYYAVLTLIVVLGLAAVVYSRYERQNPVVISYAYPAIGSTAYMGLASEACGTVLPNFFAYRTADPLFHLQVNDVVQITPTSAKDSGRGVTFDKFVHRYIGFVFTSKELGIPSATGVVDPGHKYLAGSVCPRGSKYAGQKAYPEIAYWKNIGQSKPTITTNPHSIVVPNDLLLTFAFEPKGVIPKLPSGTTINALNAAPATTTTTPVSVFPTTTTTTHTSTTTTTHTSTTTTTPKH